MSEMKKMLQDINIISFTLVDLGEFLDTHPGDRKAMEYFNHYNRIKCQMEKEFSKKYYPLSMDLNDSSSKFDWAYAPLPWEYCED